MNHENCPNCGEVWGTEEISLQECDHCPYPHEDENYGNAYWFSDYDSDEDESEEAN